MPFSFFKVRFIVFTSAPVVRDQVSTCVLKLGVFAIECANLLVALQVEIPAFFRGHFAHEISVQRCRSDRRVFDGVANDGEAQVQDFRFELHLRADEDRVVRVSLFVLIVEIAGDGAAQLDPASSPGCKCA
jgi:hypothetical protein